MDLSNSLVVLGLGSNINALKNLREALFKIRCLSHLEIKSVSRIYESKALTLDNQEQTDYLNAAILLSVKNFEPLSFLKNIKSIEQEIGRVDRGRWQSREIDVDILCVFKNNLNYEFKSEVLQIPHVEFVNREFAFKPALEVYPQVKNFFSFKFDNSIQCKISDRFFWPEFSGILNVTPDSFSDAGLYLNEEAIYNQCLKLLNQGASYIDIGAESTRPHAQVITPEEEIRRLIPAFNVICELKKNAEFHFKTSLDSRNFVTQKWCLEKGFIDILNDVSGFKDEKFYELMKEYPVEAVIMHSLTIPADKKIILNDDALFSTLTEWWQVINENLRLHNLNSDRVYFDPGIGFGKSTEQSGLILKNLNLFSEIQNKFYLGYSRKSFLTQKYSDISDKDLQTAEVTKSINLAFAQIIRVHDIDSQKKALEVKHEL